MIENKKFMYRCNKTRVHSAVVCQSHIQKPRGAVSCGPLLFLGMHFAAMGGVLPELRDHRLDKVELLLPSVSVWQ